LDELLSLRVNTYQVLLTLTDMLDPKIIDSPGLRFWILKSIKMMLKDSVCT